MKHICHFVSDPLKSPLPCFTPLDRFPNLIRKFMLIGEADYFSPNLSCPILSNHFN